MFVLLPVLAAVGLGGYAILRRVGVGSPSLSASTGAAGDSMFPWIPVRHEGVAMVPEMGKAYFVEIEDRDNNRACVQGVWIGQRSNKKPGALRVQRIVDSWNPFDPFRLRKPEAPFTIEIPPSRKDLENDYLHCVSWRSESPSVAGAKEFSGKKPRAKTRVMFVMAEDAPGNAVFLLYGQVEPETPKNWIREEGLPDTERVIVRWDRVLKVLKGNTDAPMPARFVVPVKNLIVNLENLSP